MLVNKLSTSFLLATALTMAGCDAPITYPRPSESFPASESYEINTSNARYAVHEFSTQGPNKLTCVIAGPYKTYIGTNQSCFPKKEFQEKTSAAPVRSYRLSNTVMGKFDVIEFEPRTAPGVQCVLTSPEKTVVGTSLSCN